MSDVVIFENPSNKAARLERENAQLRSENRRLREQLGISVGALVAPESEVVSQAPALPQAQTFNAGACKVTIGAKPGAGRRMGGGIPSLEQQQQQAQPGTPTVEIYNAAESQQTAPQTVASSPRTPARRMVAGQPASAGMTFDIGSMRPTPIRATPPTTAPVVAQSGDAALDDARQRFALLELDSQPQTQDVGGGNSADRNEQSSDQEKAG